VGKTIPIDVNYLGFDQMIGACLVENGGQSGIIDPGPAVSLAILEKRLEKLGHPLGELDFILLTHIHLDHAGATGTILQRYPRLRVYVHEVGARHMQAPNKLLASARRLYGDAMDYLFGEFLPVPAENLISLTGGESIRFGGRTLTVAYTPGHASHHVSYFDSETGTAFIGDTGGIRISNKPYVLPVSVPPDLDLERWHESMDLIEERQPPRLYLTHFGYTEEVAPHFEELRERMAHWSERVRAGLRDKSKDSDRMNNFKEAAAAELNAALPADDAEHYLRAGVPELSWMGLARYWRKKFAAQAASAKE
jgi:glyoxylase-like metal-dependent hydrolase (beta-lactamase superfamily II)